MYRKAVCSECNDMNNMYKYTCNYLHAYMGTLVCLYTACSECNDMNNMYMYTCNYLRGYLYVCTVCSECNQIEMHASPQYIMDYRLKWINSVIVTCNCILVMTLLIK